LILKGLSKKAGGSGWARPSYGVTPGKEPGWFGRARKRCDWLAQWEMERGVGPVWEGETRQGKKSRLAVEIGPKELREYRKELLISRI
jgi:hypothetical protein